MGKHNVIIAKNPKEDWIFLDKGGNQFKSIEGAMGKKPEQPIGNVIKSYDEENINPRREESNTPETDSDRQGGDRPLVENESRGTDNKGQNRDGQNGIAEKLNSIILESTLKNSEKVFLIQLLTGKGKQEALSVVLQAPIKDISKVAILSKINAL